MWRIADGQLIRESVIPELFAYNSLLALSPNGEHAATAADTGGSHDNQPRRREVKVWRLSDGQLVRVLDQNALRNALGDYSLYVSDISAVAFSPDGSYLAFLWTGHRDYYDGAWVSLWRVADWQLLANIDLPPYYRVWRLTFSNDGQYLIAWLEETQSRDQICWKWFTAWHFPSGTIRRRNGYPLCFDTRSFASNVSNAHFLTRASCFAASIDSTLMLVRGPFCVLRGDVNLDARVDDTDLMRVLFAFGERGPRTWVPEDLNFDGVVDDADLIVVLIDYGYACE